MQDFITIFFFITTCILFYLVVIKKNKNDTINNDIKEKNKQLEMNKTLLENDIKTLTNKKDEQQIELSKLNETINNMDASVRKAFEEYCESLDKEYATIESEWDGSIEEMEENYAAIQMGLMESVQKLKNELEKISATRAAAMEAQLKEQEIKDKQSFYCPQVPEADLKDAKTLRDIEYKLNNPRILRMLIWQSYYQKPINQVCANVLGAATAEKCGIYKITNQKRDLVYIGQAVDIATRWKNHAKAGLGIDTPANNKLYKAMLEDGLESFSFEVLEECSRQQLDEKEKFYIKLYQADQFGYNSNSGINK